MNIILITVDTLRAKQMGCYGYTRATTPALDRLAEEGLLFEEMTAPCIPTTPAYTTIYTGRHAIDHGVTPHGTSADLIGDTVLLPELLRDAGYLTAAIDDLANLKPWFVRGYDHYIDLPDRLFTTAPKVNLRAQEWLRQNKERRFFLFLHYWDPHIPYLPPKSYRRLFYDGDPYDPPEDTMAPLREQPVWQTFEEWHYSMLQEPQTRRPVKDVAYVAAQYDAEIRFVDDYIGRLVSDLHEMGLARNTVVVVTADHGESLTEHGIYFEHNGLYEQTVRVPLIIWAPGLGLTGRIPGLACHLDLRPTLLALAGQTPKDDGIDLLAAARAGAVPRETLASCECTWRAAWSWRDRRYKLIKTIAPGVYPATSPELYDLKADPSELRNLAGEQPERVAEMELALLHWQESRLGARPDPVRVWAAKGLPGTSWVEQTVGERGDRGVCSHTR